MIFMKKSAVWLWMSLCCLPAIAQSRVPPYDLWTPQVSAQIRDRSTLELSVAQKSGYWDLFFTSNPSADWFEDQPPYTEHRSEKIRIHAFLVAPASGGPYPAVVVGHGHGGHADLGLAQLLATLGYTVLAIDGPRAGQSTGGPRDQSQSWISVDQGPQYGFLYHWAYAGMRSLTALEHLAALPGNPHRIDAGKFGMLGASMGGILTAHVNGIDDRVKAAVAIVAAGPWQHILRYPNSWLYNSLYTETRDLPYNGADPLNSVENVDSDPTVITFENYFDPIRYSTRQNAPVLMVIGTHDEYFPMPTANLMQLAIASAGTNPLFEKRIWLLPNAVHGFDTGMNLLQLAAGIKQWLDYCFGLRSKPLATPQVTLSSESSGLRLEARMDEPAARLERVNAVVYAGARIDNTVSPIRDFKSYDAVREGTALVARIPAGEVSSTGEPLRADNLIYFATVTDSAGLSCSSLLYRAGTVMDLSSNFLVANRHIPGNTVQVPIPPPANDAARSVATASAQSSPGAYQGMALTNPGAQTQSVRLEARTNAGRIAAMDGLINPIQLLLPPLSQSVFVAEEWFGPGVRRLDGAFYLNWSSSEATSLGFRGDVAPSELEGISPMAPARTRLWLPLAPEQESAAPRRIRIVSGPPAAAAEVQILFRTAQGTTLESRQLSVAAGGAIEVAPPPGSGAQAAAAAEIRASAPVSARLEVKGTRDSWSLEGLSPGSAGGTVRLVQPHAEWRGVFGSRLLALNSAAAAQTLTIQVYSPAGALIGAPASRTLPAYGAISETIESILGNALPAGAGAGWFALEAASAEVVAEMLAVDPASGAAAGSVLEASGSGPWSMPFYVENNGYYTGLAVANAGAGAVNLTLTAYSPGGAELARSTQRLGPGQNRTALVRQWLGSLSAESTGHLAIAADGPLALLSYFGTDDGASLAAIPIRSTVK